VDEGRPAAPADELALLRAELNRVAPGLDLTGEFMEAGRSWSELDDDGSIVHRNDGA
jgi:hypothetical protein